MAETAELAVKLSLIDKMSPAIKRVQGNLTRFGSSVKRAAVNAGKVMAGLGTVAAVGIGAAVRSGIQSLATLESAVMSADGAIKQMGLTGKVTGAQVAGWANEIETAIGAAFDDKDITQATTTLIRFGKVTPSNLRRAMEVMTDLATKTGDVASAGTLLARALADPTKAAGKLARAGIVLTKAEQKKIAALVKAGKAAEAQAIILKALEKTTKGAAAASQGPYQRAMSVLADVTEDAQRALAEGFLPVLERVADWLSKTLADPANVQRIRDFGKALAGAVDKARTFVQGIDWKSVGDGLKVAADWAKRLFDAFMSLPPEVKGTIIALAGLNKLSGGAVGDLVSELGKGLIKGVLGITAGVVNLKAASVIGGGGPGLPGGKGGKGGLGGLGKAAGGVGALATGGVVLGVAAAGAAAMLALIYGGNALVGAKPANGEGDARPINTPGGGRITGANAGIVRLFTPALAKVEAEQKRTTAAVNASRNAEVATERGEQAKVRAKLDAVRAKEQESLVAFRAGERATERVGAKVGTSNQRLAQIARKPTTFTPNTKVNVVTSVSVAAIQQHSRYRERVAKSSGFVAS